MKLIDQLAIQAMYDAQAKAEAPVIYTPKPAASGSVVPIIEVEAPKRRGRPRKAG